MAVLTSIKNSNPILKSKKLSVPELGEDAEIIIREMTVKDLIAFQAAAFNDEGKPKTSFQHYMMLLLTYSMVDEDGNHISTEDDVEDLLDVLPGDFVTRLYDVASEINGLKIKAVEKAKK